MQFNGKSKADLRTRLSNCLKAKSRDPDNSEINDLIRALSIELSRRIGALRKDWQALAWNPETVGRAMERFVALTRTVPNNDRTYFTDSGGFKKRGMVWVDMYTAIKTGNYNIAFNAIIKEVGDDAIFIIWDSNMNRTSETVDAMIETSTMRFGPEELDEAYSAWKEIATKAGGRAP